MTNLKGKSSSKLGLFTMAYYISTTMIAIMIGITLALVIRPGDVTVAKPAVTKGGNTHPPTATDTFLDLIR